MQPIYLDRNATTPVDEEVLAAVLPWLRAEVEPAAEHLASAWRRLHESVAA